MNKEFERILLRSLHALLHYFRGSFNNEQGFAGRSFYAEPMTMALLHILDEDPEWQRLLCDAFNRREKSYPSEHYEFHYYALQLAGITPRLVFSRSCIHQVSNWVFLRALVHVRSRTLYGRLWSLCMVRLVLFFNIHEGYITDTTLRMYYLRRQSISTQYHAFATMLLGELFLETNSLYYRREFLRCVDLLRSSITFRGEIVMTGRGRRQLFGYAATAYACALAYHVTSREEYLDDFKKIFSYVSSWQGVSGHIPLVLSRSDVSFLTYDYNNSLDYLSFWGLCIVRSLRLFRSHSDAHGK